LLVDPFDAAVPATHALADANRLALSDLADQRWITGAAGGPCAEVGVAACAAAGFTPAIQHRTNDWAALFALVAAGAGSRSSRAWPPPAHRSGSFCGR